MRRVPCRPRPDWIESVESQGLSYHTIDGDTYWDESACYEFSAAEIDEIEDATNALHQMCLKAVGHVVERERWDEFGIPLAFRRWVAESWRRRDPSIYGRFDLAYSGEGPPKLLEYNADTPTAILEAAVIQWHWLEDVQPHGDQFNSLHEQLIAAWGNLRSHGCTQLHFASQEGQEEDFFNVQYLRDTAAQAGLKTAYIDMGQIGYRAAQRDFVDDDNRVIESIFKLYPWEWMLHEPFGRNLPFTSTQWIEPPWKMLLSNKALLVVLWELFPNHRNLLPTAWEPLDGRQVRKPILAREGSNVAVLDGDGRVIEETSGPYERCPVVYQQWAPLACSAGNYAVLGSWVINGVACGLGIREDHSAITHNLSRFVPHWFQP